MDAFWAAPPVTRTLAASIFVVSVLATVSILDPYRLFYSSHLLLKPLPEIWRVVSTFLYTSQWGIIMYPYFIWSYGVPLETGSSRFNSASFLVYLAFVGTLIILLAGEILGAPFLLAPLSLAITYTFAQENQGQRVTFVVVPMEVKYLPYATLFLTFILNGPQATLIESMGIPAAHFYDFLTLYWPTYGNGTNYIRTPGFVNRLFYGANPPPRPAGHYGHNPRAAEARGAGVDFRAPAARSPQSSGTSNDWNSVRGPGRRLG